MHLGARLLLALCVAAVTCLAWYVIWVLGTPRERPASIFIAYPPVSSAERFGAVWQWVVASVAIALICTLVSVPRYSRLMGMGWLLSIALLAVNASMSLGHFRPNLALLFPVILAAGLLPEIHRAATRAA
jgi:hypothetical protein